MAEPLLHFQLKRVVLAVAASGKHVVHFGEMRKYRQQIRERHCRRRFRTRRDNPVERIRNALLQLGSERDDLRRQLIEVDGRLAAHIEVDAVISNVGRIHENAAGQLALQAEAPAHRVWNLVVPHHGSFEGTANPGKQPLRIARREIQPVRERIGQIGCRRESIRTAGPVRRGAVTRAAHRRAGAAESRREENTGPAPKHGVLGWLKCESEARIQVVPLRIELPPAGAVHSRKHDPTA